MGSKEFIQFAKEQIVDYFNSRADKTDTDGMYYEITYNGDKREAYLDAYKKWENKCIPATAQ